MLSEMRDRDANIRNVAEKARRDEKLLSELLDGLKSKDEILRYNCLKVLMLISEEEGTALYPQWDYFVALIAGDNTYWKMSGLQIIANLTKIDTDRKFDKIFDRYYSLLGDKGTIVAANVAANSGKIARAKPYLQDKITDTLLKIESIHPGKQIELIKGHVIEAFGEYFEEAGNKDRILDFVQKQVHSQSPRTKKQAAAFLKKWA
jgi:hypothetical protein